MDEGNKRIAKNTALLYIRTFITMAIGLFTSRIVLEALGIDNYGIYNLVGGIVAFSTLISGTMTAACSRFITFALGKKDDNYTNQVFITAQNVQVIIGLVVVILLATVGVWYLETTANIPEGRLFAAKWVLYCSIVSTFITLATVPYGAVIVAHERFSFYAYLSLFEASAKLGVCYIVLYTNYDNLIVYAILIMAVTAITGLANMLYARAGFKVAHYRKYWNPSLIKEMAAYSSCNLMGNTCSIFNSQGVNMLINYFFGVVYNATMGIANTVNACVQGFVTNFTTAFTPQIIKKYAEEDYSGCYTLVNRGAKFTWFLMYIFIVPVCIEADTILHLWLKEVPPMTALFLRFTLYSSLVLAIGAPYYTLIQATGKVKKYSFQISLAGFIVFPLSWLAYILGAPVWISFPIYIVIYSLLHIIRFRNIDELTSYDWHSFVQGVLYPGLAVSVLSFPIPLLAAFLIHNTIIRFLIVVPVSMLSVWVCVMKFGLTEAERISINAKLKPYLAKLRIKS